MSIVSVAPAGINGLVFDIAAQFAPPRAWSSGRNVRFFDGKAFSTFGYASILGTPVGQPFYVFPVIDNAGSVLWAYFSLVSGSFRAYAIDGGIHTEITRLLGVYTNTINDLWQGYNFGGVSIFNNGIDDPQMWNTPSSGTKLIALANWPAATSARIVKGFKRYLVAYDVTQGGIRRPGLVKWSSIADIGSVPLTWDPADTTREAGEWPLLETEGAIVEVEPIGETNIIYKTDSVYTMQEIGGRYIFAFKQLYADMQILGQRCVASYGKNHIVATKEDVIIHNGGEPQSLLDDKMARWYLGRYDVNNAFRSFIAMNYAENEAWVCLPEVGNTYPNIALCINLKDKTCGIIDLPSTAHIHYGSQQTTASGTTFDSIATSFDAMVGYFGQSELSANRKRLFSASPVTSKLYLHDSGYTADGTPFESYLERVGLGIAGVNRSGELAIDVSLKKLITELYPQVTLTNGTTVEFWVGMQEAVSRGVSWLGPYVFNPQTDFKIDPVLEGRLLAVRVRAADGTFWQLDGYGVSMMPIGQF